MTTNTPDEIERAAVDAISKVVNVTGCERLDDRQPGKTPDWRLTLDDGHAADVEVTTCVDPDEARFFAAARSKDGEQKKWPNKNLSYEWHMMLDDRDPSFNKERRPIPQVVDAVAASLAAVDAKGGPPEGMVESAKVALDGGMAHFSDSESVTIMSFPGVQIHAGDRSQRLVVCSPPQWVGPGAGSVTLHPTVIASSSGRKALISDVQDAIVRKTKSDQMVNAPDLKWLAVVVDGLAAFQLKDYYGPGSRYYDHANARHPDLDGINFDYFDDAWICSLEGPVVLRLHDGGTQMTVHHV